MYYATSIKGLGQLSPEGLDCAEVVRIYEREKKLSKTRSKASHRKRAKANMEKFQAAYDQCQGEPGHRLVEAAGGVPSGLITSLTPEQVEAAVAGASGETGPGLDYTKITALVLGGALLLGGVIWFLKPKGGPRP